MSIINQDLGAKDPLGLSKTQRIVYIVGNTYKHFNNFDNFVSFDCFFKTLAADYGSALKYIWIASQGLSEVEALILERVAKEILGLSIIQTNNIAEHLIEDKYTFVHSKISDIRQKSHCQYYGKLHFIDQNIKSPRYPIDYLALIQPAVSFIEQVITNKLAKSGLGEVVFELRRHHAEIKNKLFPLSIKVELIIKRTESIKNRCFVQAIVRFYQSALLCVEMDVSFDILQKGIADTNDRSIAERMVELSNDYISECIE